MLRYLLTAILFLTMQLNAQELYPFSEPASNMPSNSLSTKLSAMYGKAVHSNRILQRYTPELMFGLDKNWMVHTSLTFSDMHADKFYFESAKLYAKWRFLSFDEVHKHFRMAAFGAAAYSRNHLDHNELSLYGDHSGVQAGIIATQLWNKLAISGTASLIEVLDEQRRKETVLPEYAFEALSYSLSAGYLLLPMEYTSYTQTNLNLYIELLGARNLDYKPEKYWVDLAPSLQVIFNSTSKLNLGYRFQLSSDTYRLMKNSYMISFEYIFLNALQKKKK